MNEITIAIIDRSELFKAGVRLNLSSQRDFRLLDCPPDSEALKFLDANSVDVILIGIDSPISFSLEIGRTIAQLYPNTRVIMLSSYYHDEELFEVLKTGAVAYVDKRTSVEDLIDVIRKASRGEYPINDSVSANPQIAERVIKQFQEIASMGLVKKEVAAPLTQREIQVLGYIANGGSNKIIAHVLGVSEQTIKNHVSAILRKLNANDRAHAVAMAIRNQWVSVRESEMSLKEYSPQP